MNGYIKIHVVYAGGELDCWQVVIEGICIGHVDDAGNPVKLPDIRESKCVTGELADKPGAY